jgi:hypothetical protein
LQVPSGENGEGDAAGWEWYMFNDFLVEKTIVEDALGFLPDWKEPCILLYRDRQSAGATSFIGQLMTYTYDTAYRH